MLVESRRGLVIERAMVGNIEPGLMFIPFHYGSWDDPSRPRAANELTLTEWEPVSKQPHFKYAVVRISRYDAGEVAARAGGAVGQALAAVERLTGGAGTPEPEISPALQPKTASRVDG